jgi:hypothetical protein
MLWSDAVIEWRELKDKVSPVQEVLVNDGKNGGMTERRNTGTTE